MIDWDGFLNPGTGDQGGPQGPLPVVGFRAFHVTYGGGALTSYSHTYTWEPGKNTSVPCTLCVQTFELVMTRWHYDDGVRCLDPECLKEHYKSERRADGVWPAFRDCRCGFWAAHTLEELMAQNYGHKDPHCLIGGIIGWGRVQVGTNLWRAQYAKILCLTDGIPVKAVIHKGRTLRWLHERHPEARVVEAARRYQVPIVPLHRLVEFMREHGEPAYDPEQDKKGRGPR